MKIPTKFEVDMTIRYLFIALLLLIHHVTDLVTLTFHFLTLVSIIHGGSNNQPLH